MEKYITTTLLLGERVSLVLWLLDQYTALGSNENDITVYLNGRPADFQRKAGGFLVFSQLESEHYQVVIESARYFREEFEVRLSELDRSNPVVWVALKPSPTYRFTPTATLIRASVWQENGQPAPGATLTATLCNDSCARAKLGRQGAAAGAAEISLVDVTGRMAPGDLFLIRPPESAGGELCEMAAMGVGESIYSLKQALVYDHLRGELLMPVIATATDERGEAVLAFRSLRQREFDVRVEVSAGGRSQVRELSMQTGLTYNLGRIVV